MDTTIQPFWKNKIFWTGLVGAALVAIQQLVLDPVINWKVIGFAAFIAIGGYVATTLRGQNISMYSMIANIIVIIITDAGDYVFDWRQLGLQAALQILAWIASDAKPVGYERADVIVNAKIQGQIVTPSSLTDNNIKAAANVAKTQAHGDIDRAVTIVKNKV